MYVRWQYWVDDGVAGKADGWYDYGASAGRTMSLTYSQWLANGVVSELVVKSGWFDYKVSFGKMMQTNLTTSKQRPIRRMICDADEVQHAVAARAGGGCIIA